VLYLHFSSVAFGVGQPAHCPATARSFVQPLRAASFSAPASVRTLLSAFVAPGVGQPAKFACLGNWSNRSDPFSLGLMSAPLSFQSLVVVVTQPASITWSLNCCACGPPTRFACPPPLPSEAPGIGQPLRSKPEPLPDVRCADARSAHIDGPDCISQAFHFSA
jgi:hypothetical protein